MVSSTSPSFDQMSNSSLGECTTTESQLIEEIRRARHQSDTEEILQLIADNNGWSVATLTNSPLGVTSMELFLLNVPCLLELRFFPNLTSLKLTHIGLLSMKNLESLEQVRELWLSDNNLTQIEGIAQMKKLRRLYLQGNLITSMGGLPPLKCLRELWLCRNRIVKIENLCHVRRLQTLWLAGNPISSVDGAFSCGLPSLSELNLGGCSIFLFNQIMHLRSLTSLRRLWFSDPLFGENPITQLNNYTTFVLHLLPSLEMLDHHVVSNEQRALSESIFLNKQTYYSMRMHCIDQNYWLMQERTQQLAAGREEEAYNGVQQLMHYLTPLRAELKERQLYNSQRAPAAGSRVTLETKKLEDLIWQLQRAVDTQEQQVQRIHRRLADAVVSANLRMSKYKEQLCLESNTGGNVRLVEVDMTSSAAAAESEWCENMRELFYARFDPALYKAFGVAGVQLHRVYRIINNGLRYRFDKRVAQLQVNFLDILNRKGLAHLFSPVPTKPEQQLDLVNHALLEGMEHLEGLGDRTLFPENAHEGLPLTNSLFYADEARLLDVLKSCGQSASCGGLSGLTNASVLCGRVLLSRVYLGKCVHALGGSSTLGYKTDHPSCNSPAAHTATGYIRAGNRVNCSDYTGHELSVYRIPSSQNPQVKVWYGLDRHLILPECVFEYSYTLTASLIMPPPLAQLSSMPDKFKEEWELLFGRAAATAGDASRDWCDAREWGYLLLDAVLSYRAGLLVHIASRETEVGLQKARDTVPSFEVPPPALGNASPATAGPGDNGDPAPPEDARRGCSDHAPLTAQVVAAYRARVELSRNSAESCSSFVFCSLHGKRLSALPADFATPDFAALLTLDLSSNALVEFSFRALAAAAPRLQHLFLQHNRLTSLIMDGAPPLLGALRTLDLSYNSLQSERDFRALAACCTQLETLSVRHNPFLGKQKNALHRVLSYFWGGFALPPSRVAATALCTLDGLRLGGGGGSHTSSLLGLRRSRTLALEDAALETALTVLCYLAHTASCIFTSPPLSGPGVGKPCAGGGSDYQEDIQDVFSLGFCGTPERAYEAALRTITIVEDESHEGDTGAGGAGATRRRHLEGMQRYVDAMEQPAEKFLSTVTTFFYSQSLTGDVAWVAQWLPSLRCLVLRSHNLTDLSPLLQLTHLEELDVQDNCLVCLPELRGLTRLRSLNISFNRICTLASVAALVGLECLYASGNELAQLEDHVLVHLQQLRELYLAYNKLPSFQSFYALKGLPKLLNLDFTGNPCSRGSNASASDCCNGSAAEVRCYIVYHFTGLKVLDGVPISPAEVQRAHEAFAGRLSVDLLAERTSASATEWGNMQELDLSHCSLKGVSLLEGFTALRVLRLHHNALVSGSGLSVLSNLHALDLSFNRLGTANPSGALGAALKALQQLESLSLEANHIANLASLELDLPQLRFLNLKGNELQSLDRGLQQLPSLTELIVDQNKLRALESDCFVACRHALTDLSADENAIRRADGLAGLTRLTRISLGANRLAELNLLLTDLSASSGSLSEAIFVGNPLTRKSNYRNTVIASLPRLTSLDRRAVSGDDHLKAEAARRVEYAVPPNVFIDMGCVDLALTGKAGQPSPPQQLLPLFQPGSAAAASVSLEGLQVPTSVGAGGGELPHGISALPPPISRFQPLGNAVRRNKPAAGVARNFSQRAGR